MGNPPPLSVDPDQLGAAGGQLLASAGQLPSAPAPFMPVGSDPLSLAIIAQVPFVETPVMTELPLVQARSTQTAKSVVGAAEAYSTTDQQLGADIGKEMQTSPEGSVVGGGPPSGAGSAGPTGAVSAGSTGGEIGQMMGMAGQMGQLPMQAMGAVAAVPQGVMQGAQQVGQQVSQTAGQVGQGGGSGDAAGVELPNGELPETELTELADEQQPADARDKQDSAAAGQPGAERAPDSSESASQAMPPGRHRPPAPPEAADTINL